METILKRDRLIVLAALAGITLLAWGYMIYEARAMYHTGVCCCAGMKMSGPDLNPWSAATLPPLFFMWAEMMVAMMIPSAAPMILTFAMVQRKRREQARPFVPVGIFLLGYLLVWTGFSALAAVAQWLLHAKALLSPLMVGTSPVLGGALLVVAGIFQWTPLKNACLTHCRSPLNFLMTDWREGKSGALAIHQMFITPATNSSAMRIQQQPVQYAPCFKPIASAPDFPSRQSVIRKFNGERQWVRQAFFSGVH